MALEGGHSFFAAACKRAENQDGKHNGAKFATIFADRDHPLLRDARKEQVHNILRGSAGMQIYAASNARVAQTVSHLLARRPFSNLLEWGAGFCRRLQKRTKQSQAPVFRCLWRQLQNCFFFCMVLLA